MNFTTYDFYTNKYYGDSVSESLFDKWLTRASDKLQAICYGRIDEKVLADYPEQIAKATCALIDALYQLNEATVNKNSAEYGNVKSMSSGGQSISFGTNETVVDKAVGDTKEKERYLYDIVSEYLGGTGLMYGGV